VVQEKEATRSVPWEVSPYGPPCPVTAVSSQRDVAWHPQEIAGALSDPVTAGTLQLVPAAERDGALPALGTQVALEHCLRMLAPCTWGRTSKADFDCHG